jgi:hypothetical protein
VPEGIGVIERTRGDTLAPTGLVSTGDATVTDTGDDSFPVSTFCTCNWATAGAARLLLATVAASVLESTTEVTIELPFQRTTAWLVKFDPVTFMVTCSEPAVIVRGRISLIFGVASCIATVPHPRQKKKNEMLMLAVTVFNIFKTHPLLALKLISATTNVFNFADMHFFAPPT